MGKINEVSSVANGVMVNEVNPTNIEKFMLRNAFANSGLLPDSVLFRVKTAFSDGVSSVESSWHLTVKSYIETIITDEEFDTRYELYPFNTPQLKETFYYRKIFESYYPNRENVIPYYWLPKFCGDMIDPSARELKI
jgi:asparagine synthase (glutamine-hydrolysing)